jgi:hypothetical protein
MKKSLRFDGPFLFAFLLAPLRVSSTSSAFAQTGVVGQWSGDSPWPTVGMDLAVLPDGRVATWGEDIPPPGTINTYIVTIPSGSTDTSKVQNLVINDDLFCAGEHSSQTVVCSSPVAAINPPRPMVSAARLPIFLIRLRAHGVPGGCGEDNRAGKWGERFRNGKHRDASLSLVYLDQQLH